MCHCRPSRTIGTPWPGKMRASVYLTSIGRNYAGASHAQDVALRDGGAAALHEATAALRAGEALAPQTAFR